jgi:hypothetical protein
MAGLEPSRSKAASIVVVASAMFVLGPKAMTQNGSPAHSPEQFN